MQDPARQSEDISGRLAAESALRQERERFRLLVDSVQDYAIIILDIEGNVLNWNAGAQRILGYSAQEIIGAPVSRFFPTQTADRGAARQEMLEAIASGRTEQEGWRIRKDGSRLWANVVMARLQDESGAVVGFTKVMRDITDRKQGEWLESDRRQVLELIARNRPLGEVMERLARMTERQFDGAMASLLILRDGRLSDAASGRLPAEFAAALAACATELSASSWAASASRHDGVIVSDIEQDEEWLALRPAAMAAGFGGAWRVPMWSGTGEAAGLFFLFFPHPMCPSAASGELVETVCKLASIAIEHRQLTDRLAHQAQHDLLTGLPNRLLFEDRLQQAFNRARRAGAAVGLILLDIDRFKYVNDTLGHPAGDQLLNQVCGRWRGCLRMYDTLARVGGDEFAIVLPELEDDRHATRIAQRILESFREPVRIEGHELFVTCSMGIAVCPRDAKDPATLQRNADVAMYRAKALGRNGYQCFAPEMNAAALQRLELEGLLRRAMDNGEFLLHFQPQVDRAGHLIGAEALMRWRHPRLGLVPPSRFIPVAEETGQIVSMGRWVIQQACRQNAAWQRVGLPPLRMAVNVSALQFAQAEFVRIVAEALKETGLDPRWLQIELTESMLMRNTEEAAARLREVRGLGVAIALDDFGTGYSSLAYLQRLPIDTLKIDRSFVAEIGADALDHPAGADTAVIRAIASLGRSLGMHVVAEGVETAGQRDFLRRIECDGMQGYLFGKALPVEEFEAMLRAAPRLCADARAA